MARPESIIRNVSDGAGASVQAPVPMKRMLVALDASGHSDRALTEAVRIGGASQGEVTGIHVYAAQMHDRRFKQMEGGLPVRYLEEEEMDYQRDVHDSLITRGLEIISDSYHDVGGKVCAGAGVAYHRLSPEGKNYRRISEVTNSGNFDVLVMGSVGLGAVSGCVIGSVCERVVRRSPIDVLVIRDTEREIGSGPIVVAIDGSEKSYGALVTGLELGRKIGAEVHIVAAYDPYYHYVAFNKIAGVLSEEAGKVFRFKEQEQLHEELIDDGIAKIYQSHLEIAARVAGENGHSPTCSLLDGKPYKAIVDYLKKVDASLLIAGKTGIHADAELDIGGNAENLLRLAPCHVWLGQAVHTPSFDMVADETISWSNEAEARLAKAPSFAQDIARKAILRLAMERGHTFVTSDLVEEASKMFMPGRTEAAETPDRKNITWSDEAIRLVAAGEDKPGVGGVRLRAEKRARRQGSETVETCHVIPFLDNVSGSRPVSDGPMPWAAASLARLSKIPEAFRDIVRKKIENLARERGSSEVTNEIAEEGFVEARENMCTAMLKGGHSRQSGDRED